MTLDELIGKLAAEDPERVLPIGFGNPHSYRGHYEQLAFEPALNAKIGGMLADTQRARGATYQGWKGGDFTMEGYTDCWLSEEGHGDGEGIGPVLLTLMLASDQLSEATQAALAGLLPRCYGWDADKKLPCAKERDHESECVFAATGT